MLSKCDKRLRRLKMRQVLEETKNLNIIIKDTFQYLLVECINSIILQKTKLN